MFPIIRFYTTFKLYLTPCHPSFPSLILSILFEKSCQFCLNNESPSLVWGSNHGRKNVAKSIILRQNRTVLYLGQYTTLCVSKQVYCDIECIDLSGGGLILTVMAMFSDRVTNWSQMYSCLGQNCSHNSVWYSTLIRATSARHCEYAHHRGSNLWVCSSGGLQYQLLWAKCRINLPPM